ncbi:MAG: HEAT repeat domain-containing protein [Cyanobacteria bacterium P01_B01_bin.77]
MANLRAESLLIAQSSAVDPSTAVDTGQTVPDVRGLPNDSPLQTVTSEQQVEEIKTIQRELQNRGYYNGPIDGIYGPGTAEAIRTLRGQAEDSPPTAPGLLSPDTAPADGIPEAGVGSQTEWEGATEQPVEDADNPEVSDGSPVRLNPTDPITEEINLGDSVSPETGIEPTAAETAPAASDVQTDAQTTEEPSSPGLGGTLLWPGLALIAALGSFGIGFMLANRSKSHGDDELESPWGDVPAGEPHRAHDSPQSSLNGYGTAHDTADDQTSEHIAQSNHRFSDSLPTDSLPTVSSTAAISAATTPTTRLAKVDVIDELVSNLQVSDPAKRRKAIWELGQRGNSSAVQHLVNTMVDADSKEKSLILAALSEIGIRSLKPMNRALAIALQDDNPDVRKNAIRDLTRVYDLVTQISQMLGHATEDEDSEVRRTAEWALEQLNRIREAPKLKSSLNTLDASRSPSELLPDEVKNLKN